eukprot:scaffold184049_cov32-Tisochrysis_lutea.AAC.4
MRSIGSVEPLRRPAVSERMTGNPPSCNETVTTSRVVPSTGDTIAASRWESKLSNDDLPALGGPRMATRTPSRTCMQGRARDLFRSYRRRHIAMALYAVKSHRNSN